MINAIRDVLATDLNSNNIDAFHAQARLNEDLYLDSILVLQVLICLELKLGIDVPDDAFNAKDFETVESLSHFLLGRFKQPTRIEESRLTNTNEAEEFEDIKVHCFVSCLCEAIKAKDCVDHRPFYFGVWDADVVVDNNYCIHYHGEDLNHDFFRYWYQKLYGVNVIPWYQPEKSKSENITTLLGLLDNKTHSQNIMVMLDMFRLPERENKFNQNPFPHYVMLENSQDPEKLMMFDPDFRWEGEQDKQQVIHAIESEKVAGGYIFDSIEIKRTENKVLHDYFLACINLDANPMTDAVRRIIDIHLAPDSKVSATQLTTALAQLPVLAIRKYAYEHGLAFFMLALELDFDEFEGWCDVIEELVSTYKQIQFKAMKIATIYNERNKAYDDSIKENTVPKNINNVELTTALAAEITHLLDQQNLREFSIKKHINSLFDQWKQQIKLTKKQLNDEVYV